MWDTVKGRWSTGWWLHGHICLKAVDIAENILKGCFKYESFTIFVAEWELLNSCRMSGWPLDLQEVKMVLVTVSFNSEDKSEANVLTVFLDTRGSTCACKSLCSPLLEFLPWGPNSATLHNMVNLSLLRYHHVQRICRCTAFAHT